ncbi:MAG: gas vesicle protein GvpN [Chloroflexi bacterium]|nr:gas vesicle protein GvpN [Chloroflexota bacterium]
MARPTAASVLSARPRAGFVETPFVRDLTERALSYIAAGYPVHFCGPSGSGKTTLAMHVAHRLGQPIMLVCGDDEFGTSDLVGGQHGFRRRKVVDNYIHSVVKTEEDVAQRWVDNRLTMACREGLALVYDEFTRSRPEANNVLLSVLEEKILVLPSGQHSASYLRVHPNFVALFTSNPGEYAGVHKVQDALRDRMLTIYVDYFDRETEVAITMSRSGVTQETAERLVDLVRAYRDSGACTFAPTVRNCIMLAKVLAVREARAEAGDRSFEQSCIDVLGARMGDSAQHRARAVILDLVEQHCPPTGGLLCSLARPA